MKPLILAVALLATYMAPHDFFISILTIKHDVEAAQLQLTWRMTTHDVEDMIAVDLGGRKPQLGSELELPGADSLLQAYVLDHLMVEIDGTPVEVRYLGRDVEMEQMYCYLQIDDVGSFKTITVHSTLLSDMIDEQENVVHLEADGSTLSHSFRSNSGPYTFMLDR